MLPIVMGNNMTKSIVQKMKGLFMSKEKKADTGIADENAGFEVLDDALASDADVLGGGLDESVAIKEETLTEEAVASDEVSEETTEIEPETEIKAEKAHEKKARIAAEMNTKGYGF